MSYYSNTYLRCYIRDIIASSFYGLCWQNMYQKIWNMAVCLVTWWLQDHHRWSLQVASQEGSSSAVHHNPGGSRASPVHIILWSLATWSEQLYSLRQKQTYMSRNINTSSKIHLHAPDYLYKIDIREVYIPKSMHIQSSVSFPSILTFGSFSFLKYLYWRMKECVSQLQK